jgi:hypothetical protein
MDAGGSFPGIKRQKREADHSPPASAEVKQMWLYTSIPLYAFMGTPLPFLLCEDYESDPV